MKAFWADVLEPLLDLTSPGTIVEIGAEVGGNTTTLIRWVTEHGATLHSIDPVPGTAVRNLAREHPETFVLHRALSLAALPAIADPDVVLVDGDHNWYTVHGELTLMAREYASWPLTVLHDIGRPYGRLDMYYKPENVPVEWRQRYGGGLGKESSTIEHLKTLVDALNEKAEAEVPLPGLDEVHFSKSLAVLVRR